MLYKPQLYLLLLKPFLRPPGMTEILVVSKLVVYLQAVLPSGRFTFKPVYLQAVLPSCPTERTGWQRRREDGWKRPNERATTAARGRVETVERTGWQRRREDGVETAERTGTAATPLTHEKHYLGGCTDAYRVCLSQYWCQCLILC